MIDDLNEWKKANPDHKTKAGRARLAALRERREQEKAIRQMFEVYGFYQDCDSCGLRPEEDVDFCVVNRKQVERGRRRMCKHYCTHEQVATAQQEIDRRKITPIQRTPS